MANAKLISIKLERFKSYEKATEVEFAPLTVVVGRNNSGKSSLIQALLLLRQTLKHPRQDVALHLTGEVNALHLRELTSGWPEGERFPGPSITLCWYSEHESLPVEAFRNTWITLEYAQIDKHVVLERIELAKIEPGRKTGPRAVNTSGKFRVVHEKILPRFTVQRTKAGEFECLYMGQTAEKLVVELDHFLPYIQLVDRRKTVVGNRQRDRTWERAFIEFFADPLEDLGELLRGLIFLGSNRPEPPSVYKPVTTPPEDLGMTGEDAAHMFYSRRSDIVHYLPPLPLKDGRVGLPENIRGQPLETAVNEVFAALGIDAPISIQDVPGFGFRLLFGRASLEHVGRGINYLLPVVELGLVADPLRFDGQFTDGPLAEYLARCKRVVHCAIEEIESHLHPRVQSRLSHWLVSLAMSGRRLIVETHSDHLVRRLRGLVARAEPGGALEQWLLENVAIVEVEQDVEGRSTLRASRLTTEGSIERWPADFMDEATDEERSIYVASLDKPQASEPEAEVVVMHDVGPEPEEAS